MRARGVERIEFYFLEEPTDRTYEDLISFLVGRDLCFGVTVRVTPSLTPEGKQLLEALRMMGPADCRGEELEEGLEGIVTPYTLEAFGLINGRARGLYQWLQPSLPENPTWWGKDGALMLMSDTLDEEAWLYVSESEKTAFLNAVPDIAIVRTEVIEDPLGEVQTVSLAGREASQREFAMVALAELLWHHTPATPGRAASAMHARGDLPSSSLAGETAAEALLRAWQRWGEEDCVGVLERSEASGEYERVAYSSGGLNSWYFLTRKGDAQFALWEEGTLEEAYARLRSGD